MATVGMVAGIVGTVLILFVPVAAVQVIALFAGIAGIILGAGGLSRSRMLGRGRGQSVTGLVLGIVTIAVFVLLMVVYLT